MGDTDDLRGDDAAVAAGGGSTRSGGGDARGRGPIAEDVGSDGGEGPILVIDLVCELRFWKIEWGSSDMGRRDLVEN